MCVCVDPPSTQRDTFGHISTHGQMLLHTHTHTRTHTHTHAHRHCSSKLISIIMRSSLCSPLLDLWWCVSRLCVVGISVSSPVFTAGLPESFSVWGWKDMKKISWIIMHQNGSLYYILHTSADVMFEVMFQNVAHLGCISKAWLLLVFPPLTSQILPWFVLF